MNNIHKVPHVKFQITVSRKTAVSKTFQNLVRRKSEKKKWSHDQRSAIPVFLRSIPILRLKSSTGRYWDWYSKPWQHDTDTETDTQNIGITILIPRLRLKSIMRLRLILRLYCISYVKLAEYNYENSAFANFINFFDTDTETDTQIGQNSIPRLILILRKLVSRDWDRDWDQKSHETGSIPRVSPTSAVEF